MVTRCVKARADGSASAYCSYRRYNGCAHGRLIETRRFEPFGFVYVVYVEYIHHFYAEINVSRPPLLLNPNLTSFLINNNNNLEKFLDTHAKCCISIGSVNGCR